MKIGIVGLGLIGGSLAKAISQNTNHRVYGVDLSHQVVKKAVLIGAVEQPLTPEILSQCDLTIIALYPEATIEYVKEHGDIFKSGSIVLDCCGVKKMVCDELISLGEEKGFYFVGGHPMAGVEHSGFTYARRTLFNKASMIFTTTRGPIENIEILKSIFTAIGFTNIEITTPELHDKKIAFTSQLAHVVSNAYIKSPTAQKHMGFSAGSYKDLTRVAKLNEEMWSELFLENAGNLLMEIDMLMDNIKEYRDAIDSKDRKKLCRLLKEGREKKEMIDGEVF